MLAQHQPAAPCNLCKQGPLSIGCLAVLAVMPVSAPTTERSLSVMRRVKAYLQSTMGTVRLSGLGLLNVYLEKEVNTECIIDIFANKQSRRLSHLFRDEIYRSVCSDKQV